MSPESLPLFDHSASDAKESLSILSDRLHKSGTHKFYPSAFLKSISYEFLPRKTTPDEKDLLAQLDKGLAQFEINSRAPSLSQEELKELAETHLNGQKRVAILRARMTRLPNAVGRKAWLSALDQAETDLTQGHEAWHFSQLNEALDQIAYLEGRCAQLEANPQSLSTQFLNYLNTLKEKELREYVTVNHTGGTAHFTFHFTDPFEAAASRIQHFIGPDATTLGIKLPLASLPNYVLKKESVAYAWSPSKGTWCTPAGKRLTILDGTDVVLESIHSNAASKKAGESLIADASASKDKDSTS